MELEIESLQQPQSQPEVALWCAVIFQCYSDADAWGKMILRTEGFMNKEIALARKKFLLLMEEVKSDWMGDVCEIVGLDFQAFKDHFREYCEKYSSRLIR